MNAMTRAACIGAACLLASTALAQPSQQPVQVAHAAPSGPDARVKVTDEYAALVGSDAYFWAWPLVDLYNRRLAAAKVTRIVRSGAEVSAPLNRLGMLTDYADPAARSMTCPDQDMVSGLGVLALDVSPVVVQVPDFGDRFWVYQAVDLRTDSFAQLGKVYDTKPGFYLLVGPNWQGQPPKGIAKVFRASTNTGLLAPRIFQEDTPEDKRAIQAPLRQVVMYPLSEYDGTMKSVDWSKLPQVPATGASDEAVKWVQPDGFVDQLGAVLADAPPLPGEEARYTQMRAMLDVARTDPRRREAMTNAVVDADAKLVEPLFQFRAWGQQLPYNWSTMSNGAAFGTDYFTRTAVAKSNILVGVPKETKYFYQDLDAAGARLNGRYRYTMTFPKGLTPPVNGSWSLALYDRHHLVVPNDIGRSSIGGKNKDLKLGPDGSLTIYIQADPPPEDQRANWLPAPKDSSEAGEEGAAGDFSLVLRAYGPKPAVLEGAWTPPPVENAD